MKKPKSRGNGDGTIYYDAKKKYWIAQITAGANEKGKLKRITRYGKTKKEVKAKIDKVRVELQQGTYT